MKDEGIKNPKSEDEKKKESLILALDNSANFANTHTIISEMEQYHNWSEEQAKSLFRIGVHNSQVNWILKDEDVFGFYTNLLSQYGLGDDYAEEIKKELETED